MSFIQVRRLLGRGSGVETIMKKIVMVSVLAAAVGMGACNRETGLEIQPGSDVTLERKDGVKVAGRLVEVKPEHVIVETRDGARTTVTRSDIAGIRAQPSASAGTAATATERSVGSTGAAPTREPAPADRGAAAREDAAEPRVRTVTLPSGTALPVELTTAMGSETSKVEDAVRGRLSRAVLVDGARVLPEGTPVLGFVTGVERAGRVKGRAAISFRFTSIDPPGAGERLAIRTEPITRVAPATKKQDAAKIGGGAAGGAILGGILGGGDGAAKGAAIGGAAGTGVVLSTRGKEVRLGPGADITVRLAAPVDVSVR